MTLTPYELQLLPSAIQVAQEAGEVPSRRELRRTLSCGSVASSNLRRYLAENGFGGTTPDDVHDVAVDADESTPEEDAEGNERYLQRENSRLVRALAKTKYERKAQSTSRENLVRDELLSLKEQGKAEAQTPRFIPHSAVITGNMLEVNIPDAHFGKQAWGVETGGAPYDTKIAAAMYTRAVDALIARTVGYKFDEILYVIGNDLLNTNDVENHTAHGTVVSTDGRYHKTFWKVRSTIVTTIEKLRLLAPVRVVAVYGNHDTLSSWHLADSLECYFNNYPDVTVENNPTYRKYVEFGKVMLMLTHGDKGKQDDYPLLMATEQPQMWARTAHREAHVGHLHKTKVNELHGVRVRTLSALCPGDDWHAEMGFVGNLRNAEAFIWNRVNGLVGIAIYNDDSQEPITTKRTVVN